MELSDLSGRRVPPSCAPSHASTLLIALGGILKGFQYPRVVPSIDRFGAESCRALVELLLELWQPSVDN